MAREWYSCQTPTPLRIQIARPLPIELGPRRAATRLDLRYSTCAFSAERNSGCARKIISMDRLKSNSNSMLQAWQWEWSFRAARVSMTLLGMRQEGHRMSHSRTSTPSRAARRQVSTSRGDPTGNDRPTRMDECGRPPVQSHARSTLRA